LCYENSPLNIILYSSGVDSYIGYYYLKDTLKIENLIPVYINLNHIYSKTEQQYIMKYRPNCVILEFNQISKYEHHDAFIPNRNLLMALLTTIHFNYNNRDINIYTGGLLDDRISDNNREIYKEFSSCLTKSNNPIKVKMKSAFNFNLTKSEIVNWFIERYGNIKDLSKETFSCYNPDVTKPDPHCYNCRACFRRNVALFPYKILPFNKNKIVEYYSELKSNKEKYNPIRWQQSMKYCETIIDMSNKVI